MPDIKEKKLLSITESVYELKLPLERILFPKISPTVEGYFRVSDVHSIWYAEYGNPNGIAVVAIHGGPGGGAGENDMRFFDPKIYRIILFDQRGAKRSQPFGELRENNTQALVSDIEMLRKHLGIKRWLVFGGSWGSALSMLYGQAYPRSCLGFILRGIFLGSKEEYEQLWQMNDIFPDLWDELEKFLPKEERGDLIKSYYKRFIDTDPNVHMPAARQFAMYDFRASFLMNGKTEKEIASNSDDKLTLGVSRLFAHYCINRFFITSEQIIDNIHKISHLPAIIVHGRYDIICRAKSAYRLYKSWSNSELVFVQDAGHASIEPGIAKALVEATNKIHLTLQDVSRETSCIYQ